MLTLWGKSGRVRKTYPIKESTRQKKLASARAYYRSHSQRLKKSPELVRRYKLQQKYGITIEEYEQMLAQQKGRCMICRKKPSDSKKLAVDHCHKTGKVRGLLCHHCNNGLGCFKDDTELMTAAIAYVTRHAGA